MITHRFKSMAPGTPHPGEMACMGVDLRALIAENLCMAHVLHRALYHGLIALGRPIGGIRPRRLYDSLGRRAYPRAEFHWTRDCWGSELFLSHHYHLDRNILIYGDYDHDLHLLFEARIKPGMTVLDVGANLGEMALHMAKLVGEAGMVHAFEPMPAAFARLAAHVARNHVAARARAWQVALGDAAGEAEMNVPLEEVDNQGLGSLVNPDIAAASERVRIGVETLDGLRARGEIGKVDFIKLDIQGAEWLFLQGAAETLRGDRPEIVMEISPDDLAKIGKTSRQLVGAIESLGYRVFEIARGAPRRGIAAASIAEHYAATNVLCVPV